MEKNKIENNIKPFIIISPFYLFKNNNNKDNLNEQIIYYYNFIYDYLNNHNKVKVCNRINDLTVVQCLFKNKSNYNYLSNKIDFAYNIDCSDIFHQFMVAISSNCSIQGFKYNDLGCGISDYFEKYVGKTLFDFDYKKEDSFGIEVVSFITRMCGFENMLNYYVSNDLKSLFFDLASYSSIEDINKFIKNMDIISYVNKDISPAKDRVKAKEEIRGFLIKLYSNKVLSSEVDYSMDEFESYMFGILSNSDIPSLSFDDEERLYYVGSNISEYIIISSIYDEYFSTGKKRIKR